MKQIEQYNDAASYNSAGKPTTESRVANIKAGNISKFDGVNVPTTDTPMFGDAVYLDENGNKVEYDQSWWNEETGEEEVSTTKTLLSLAKALDCSVGDFFDNNA